MRTGFRLEDLLEVENAPPFAEVVCPSTGVLVWPSIRVSALRLILQDLLYSGGEVVAQKPEVSLSRLGSAVTRSIAHNATHWPQPAEVLLYATGAGHIERAGRSFNRYTDYFAELLGSRCWSVEGLFRFQPPVLPRWNRRVTLSTPQKVAAYAIGRVGTRDTHRRVAAKLIELVERRGRGILDWEMGAERKAWLIEACARQLANNTYSQVTTRRLLRRVRPRLLLVEEGCYGQLGVVIATARDEGVTVAEFQHGIVTSGHDAYNVAPVLQRSDAYRRTLPELFLGWGEWGNRQFNAPVEKVVIGSPHRSATIRSMSLEPRERNTVMVVGDGIDTEAYLSFCHELEAMLGAKRKVVFRPHPLEREEVLRKARETSLPFGIDTAPDVFDSLTDACAVVSEMSTVLFEAVGIAERVFVWNTAKSRFVLPEHPFV